MQKKWVIGITAVTLAAATAIGSTLAYFTATTQKMTNSFTVATGNDKGITGQLREKTWDGYDFYDFVGSKVGQNPDGSALKDGLTEANPAKPTYGVDMAKIILPGDVIPKDPTLMNTTNCDDKGSPIANMADVPVYMALKVTYNNFNNVKINSDNKINAGWVEIPQPGSDPAATCTKYYVWYGKDPVTGKTLTAPAQVSSGAKTDPLFNTVTVNSDATYVDGNQPTDLKAFNIVLQGAAIQARNVPGAEINSRLTALLP